MIWNLASITLRHRGKKQWSLQMLLTLQIALSISLHFNTYKQVINYSLVTLE